MARTGKPTNARPSKITMGIDEAGRGPAIGPMVMAAVCLDSSAARILSRAGLRDSKSFGGGERARQRRTELALRIRERALHIQVRVLEVETVDRRVKLGELNELEREVAHDFVGQGPRSDRIVADGKVLFGRLAEHYSNFEAWNNGESRHAAVAAASIMAKTRRDEIFAEIERRYHGEFGAIGGGGYVNAATRRFLRAYAERHGRLPKEARRSWPHPYLRDILGSEFGTRARTDSRNTKPKTRGQLNLF